MRAETADGVSVASNKATAFVPFTTPGPVREFTVSADNGTVTLSWQPPTDTGGGVSDYEYRIDTNNDGSWNKNGTVGGGATSVSVSVSNGRDYGLAVRAKNSAGSSTYSAKSTAHPVDPSVSPPSAPRNLQATAENRQVRLSWNTPSSSNGIIAYEYKYDTGNDGSWRSWKLINNTSTSFTVTGLTNETLYAFKVRARNAGGIGTASSKATARPTAVTPPSKPRNLTVSLRTDGRIYLNWDAPSDNGGSPVTDYKYSYDTYNDGSWSAFRSAGDTSTDEYLTGWTPGVTYAYRVRAVNKAGEGSPSEKAVLTLPNVPTKPRNLTATLRSDGSVYLDWDAPTDNGGSAITDYEYIIDTDNDGSWGSWSTTGDTSTDEYVFECTRGTTYAFKVRAHNNAGAGTASDKATLTIPAMTTPSAPQDFTAEPGNASVYLSWSSPADDGYGGIRGESLNYEYRYRASGGTWNTWSAEQWETSVTINALTNGTTYEFEVRATNESGAGTAATVSATPTNTAVPGVPLYFDTFSENGAVDLWWDAPEFDGGTPITDYEYRYRQSGGTWNAWTSAGNANVDLPEYLVTGLTNGTTYDFQVRARNAVGTGPSTETLSETPNAQEPDAPTGVSAAAGSTTGTIVLTWTAPNDNGSPITDYKVRYCKYDNGWKSRNWTDLASTGSTSTSHTVTGLESGALYRFRVVATNSVGDSGTSRVAQTRAP